ncbi:MAG: hypothetical protein PF487_04430 [Bacteroidales bacterium]|jgi:transcriptional regulator of heat shock response|nr:hypothetical protein [Bacteroidales bacterium]
MNTEIFPELKKYLPIDIEKCRNHWNEKMNGFKMKSFETKDWKKYEEFLNLINDDDYPVTTRTYFLVTNLPFIITNFIIEGKATVDK